MRTPGQNEVLTRINSWGNWVLTQTCEQCANVKTGALPEIQELQARRLPHKALTMPLLRAVTHLRDPIPMMRTSSHWIFYGGSRPYRTYNGTQAIFEDFQSFVLAQFRKCPVVVHDLNDWPSRGVFSHVFACGARPFLSFYT